MLVASLVELALQVMNEIKGREGVDDSEKKKMIDIL